MRIVRAQSLKWSARPQGAARGLEQDSEWTETRIVQGPLICPCSQPSSKMSVRRPVPDKLVARLERAAYVDVLVCNHWLTV